MSFHFCLFFSLALPIFVSLEPLPQAQPLIGGKFAQSYGTSVVRILLYYNEGSITVASCLAFFISKRALLTSAHCFEPNLHALEMVNYNGEKTTVVGAGFAKHPMFDSTSYAADIAVILLGDQLSWAVPFSIDSRPLGCSESLREINFQAIKQPEKPSSFTEKLGSIFERTSPQQKLQKHEAREFQVSTLTVIADCGKSFPTKLSGLFNRFRGKESSEDWIITSREGVSMCRGYGGGPLLRDGLAIGILIGTDSKDQCNSGAHYYAIKIANYLKFIKEYVPEATVVSR